MSGQPYVLARAPYKDIRNSHYQVAVLPWGATEPHNYHLPFGTDIFECDYIAAESARIASEDGAGVIVLPTVPFGVNTGQLDILLTINMNPSTQMALLRDVVSSLEHHGVPKLVILNGHGGNDFKQMIRELQPTARVFLSTVNWYKAVDPGNYFKEPGDHAGEMESSIMMHIGPDLTLPLSEAGEGSERKMKIQAFREGWAWTPRQWTKVSADTGVGNPKKATAQNGARYLEAVTRKVGGFLVELSNADVHHLYL